MAEIRVNTTGTLKLFDADDSHSASIKAGTLSADVASITLESAETVFNEDSADIDFRVEGNGNANMLFVDAGNDRVGIGTSSPGSVLQIDGASTPKVTIRTADGTSASVKLQRVDENDASTDYELKNDGGVFKLIGDNNSQDEYNLINSSTSEVVINEGSNDIDFRVETDANTHMLFVDAANDALCIGNSDLSPSTSSSATHAVFKNGGSKLEISASSNPSLAVNRVNSEGTAVELRQAGGLRGSISVAGATAAFNTSSDYRLKENVSYDWDATTRLKQLKPARFNWISDGTNTLVDGFLAHEAKTVVPESVIGEKDAVDENGDVDPQQIDHSKLVPLLVKTIQELEARIKILEG